jgi:peptidoglycan hydrolase-like protein with peptidoglycan-binding domain
VDSEPSKTLARRTVLGLLGSAAGAAGLAMVTESPARAAPAGAPEEAAAAVAGKPAPVPEAQAVLGDVRVYVANSSGHGLLGALVDDKVLAAQRWVNATYGAKPGFVKAPEDGRTGSPTMSALTMALQIELGLSGAQLSPTFGPTTLSLLTSKFGNIGAGKPANVIKIVQSGQYCKGYDGANITGTYGTATKAAVLAMRKNMGFTDTRDTVAPKEFKALLSMDAYVIVENGSAAVRAAQQWMNRRYIAESWFFIMPTDGHSSGSVAKALIYAVQTELGVAGANGNVGPATRAALKAKPALIVGATDTGSSSWIRLFQAGMIFGRNEVAFDGVYSKAVSAQVKNFQSFVALPANGTGDYPTWCSLLVANGDPDRAGIVADGITPITPAKATSLVQAGYRIAARYLTGSHQLQPGELATIFAAGLRVVPLFETGGTKASYFTPQQGAADANQAVTAATGYGFKRGAILYFAVDYDAMNADIASNVIPYFTELKHAMALLGDPYRIGVYAPRNACSQLGAAGLTVSSMAGDIAFGYSGNIGFPLPPDWAFDQIATLTVGSGDGAVNIDKSVASGRDPGQSEVAPRTGRRGRLDIRSGAYAREALLPGLRANLPQDGNGAADALDMVIAYDELITNLSRSYGVRKALIQAPVLWGYSRETASDRLADAQVASWYSHKVAHEAADGGHSDSTVGVAQLSAATAIGARNWASAEGLVAAAHLDASDWRVTRRVWTSLREDGNYNIGTVPLVLFHSGSDAGVKGQRLTYTDAELHTLFDRYSGSADAGKQLHALYQLFESYNSKQR